MINFYIISLLVIDQQVVMTLLVKGSTHSTDLDAGCVSLVVETFCPCRHHQAQPHGPTPRSPQNVNHLVSYIFRLFHLQFFLFTYHLQLLPLAYSLHLHFYLPIAHYSSTFHTLVHIAHPLLSLHSPSAGKKSSKTITSFRYPAEILITHHLPQLLH